MGKTRKRPSLEGIEGNETAKKRAWMVLSVLTGQLGVSEAAREERISPSRYYQLEERALKAMVYALSPEEGQARGTLQERLERAQDRLKKRILLRLLEPVPPLPAPPVPAPMAAPPAAAPPPAVNRIPEERREAIRAFSLLKRGTYGAQTIKMAMNAPESLSTIKRILQEKEQENPWPLHDVIWTRVNACHAADFLHLGPLTDWGRMATVQEAYSRYKPLWEVRRSWDRERVGPRLERYLEAVWNITGVPLFLKHDLGSEFLNREFKVFLENFQVIALPSPARRPSYNGQEERGNRFIRAWTRPVEEANQHPRLPEILTETILDLNYQRPLAVLEGKTPYDAFREGPRIDTVDRKGLLQRAHELVTLFEEEQSSRRENDAPGCPRIDTDHALRPRLPAQIGEKWVVNPPRRSRDPFWSQRNAAKVAAQEYGLLQIRPRKLCQPISA